MKASEIACGLASLGSVSSLPSPKTGSFAAGAVPKGGHADLATKSLSRAAAEGVFASLGAPMPGGMASIGITDETKRMLSDAVSKSVLPRDFIDLPSPTGSFAAGAVPKGGHADLATKSLSRAAAEGVFASLGAPMPGGMASIGITDETKRMLSDAALASAALGELPMRPRLSPALAPRPDWTAEKGVVVDPAELVSGEIGEVLAIDLVRTDREEAVALFTEIELDDAQLHLEAIEERLNHDTKPAHLHAALSASLLLLHLADRLFPPRPGDFWPDRFGQKHALDSARVGSRLSAYVDHRLRSQLSTKEHRLFQATLDAVLAWAGEGHHVLRDPRYSARAFRQLLEVLAMVARAYQAPA